MECLFWVFVFCFKNKKKIGFAPSLEFGFKILSQFFSKKMQFKHTQTLKSQLGKVSCYLSHTNCGHNANLFMPLYVHKTIHFNCYYCIRAS